MAAMNALRRFFFNNRSLAINRLQNRSYSDVNNKEYLPFERPSSARRRFGYRPHFHTKGLLPRLKDDSLLPLKTLPQSRKPDPWCKKEALFGQNDYIDILGNDEIKPHMILKHVPFWLRGFRGNEMKVLQRRVALFKHFQWTRPQKWKEMNKRIDFLYKYLNFKSKPPQIEKY